MSQHSRSHSAQGFNMLYTAIRISIYTTIRPSDIVSFEILTCDGSWEKWDATFYQNHTIEYGCTEKFEVAVG